MLVQWWKCCCLTAPGCPVWAWAPVTICVEFHMFFFHDPCDFFWFPKSSQKHEGRWIYYTKDVIVMDRPPVPSLFLTHVQCSQESPWSQSDPDHGWSLFWIIKIRIILKAITYKTYRKFWFFSLFLALVFHFRTFPCEGEPSSLQKPISWLSPNLCVWMNHVVFISLEADSKQPNETLRVAHFLSK